MRRQKARYNCPRIANIGNKIPTELKKKICRFVLVSVILKHHFGWFGGRKLEPPKNHFLRYICHHTLEFFLSEYVID